MSLNLSINLPRKGAAVGQVTSELPTILQAADVRCFKVCCIGTYVLNEFRFVVVNDQGVKLIELEENLRLSKLSCKFTVLYRLGGSP